MEFLYQYGLFLAETVTFVVAFIVIAASVAGVAQKPKAKKGQIELDDVSLQLNELKSQFLSATLSKDEFKAFEKDEKKRLKQQKNDVKNKVYVLDFNGSIDAREVDELREEITAILTVAQAGKDQVLLRLESGGGVVHGYGLAASQLERIKNAGINLTVCVDKVAASGGYMMACVADKVVAAPFAIIGSIGVIAQIPNFNKILKKNDIEFEQITAGEFKRTLTLFGENTDQARDKFREEIQQTHELFKQFVSLKRPTLDLTEVATGEHWFASQAIEKGLVDEIATSDDVLLTFNQQSQIYKVKFSHKKSLADKFSIGLTKGIERSILSIISTLQRLKP